MTTTTPYVTDADTGWECRTGASLIAEATSPGPGALGTLHGVIYVCPAHQADAEALIRTAGCTPEIRDAPTAHRWDPWPCGHITTFGPTTLNGGAPVLDGCVTEIETSGPTFTACTAVRITSNQGNGLPDPASAVTYRFTTPIAFAYVYRTRLSSTITTAAARPLPSHLALLAPRDHPESNIVHAAAQGLWQRRSDTISVELWSTTPALRYLLIPRWRRIDPDGQPVIELPGHRTHAAGEALPTSRPALWPRLDPAQAAYAVEQGTMMLIASDTDPPPPCGVGHRVRSGLENANPTGHQDSVRALPGQNGGRTTTHP
ncbi:hypothetical protein ACFWVB_02555 [Streptomyces microflavus]|uniref:hypothetical protein n=1 Tax=Streptomyces microflavus TaxID=1919 RepID=UPI0036542AE0